ncbi:MAG: L,D-transpeptidase family protein, partial [Deltaproteobacteria bacterium]|nr:L,D-transpeptidase family protein [Deltaproteobacteria bacterium]
MAHNKITTRASLSKNAYIPVSLLILASIFILPTCALSSGVSSISSLRSVQPGQLNDSLEKRIGESSQVLLVRNTDPASIDVRIVPWERQKGSWQCPFAPLYGVIGRKGFAPPGKKREGDGRTPSGIFPLGTVFGYEPSFPTRMPYRQANVDDLWVDDVQADDYNRWVRQGTTQAASFERMRRDDDLYKYGIVVEYNTNPVVKGYGSAIFFHLWRGRGIATAGCIALPEEDLI